MYRYLWPNFDESASYEHIMFIALMINEKFRENVPAWGEATSCALCASYRRGVFVVVVVVVVVS